MSAAAAATAETLAVNAADGHRFEASLYRAAAESAPVLVFLPALGTPGKVYRHLAAALAGEGVQVCLPDWRGMASSSLRPSRRVDFGYRELIELDVPALLDELAGRLPRAPVWIGGHSLGGQLGALVAAARPQVRGLVAVASGTVSLPSFSPRLQRGMRLVSAIASASGPVLGYFPGERLGFGGREARTLMKDWTHVARTGCYEPAGSSMDYEAALARLAVPVLTLNFERDSWAPAKVAALLMSKLPACRQSQWIWGDADCGGRSFDHFSWIKAPQLLAPKLAGWIRDSSGMA